jgi:hypothetical protein
MMEFGKLLSETMDLTIKQVFGESASELIYGFMERQASLKRKEIGEDVESFYSYLERLLGSERTQAIHVVSLRQLCLKLRREYEEVERHLLLLDQLYEVKFKLLAMNGNQESSVCQGWSQEASFSAS